MSISRPYAAGIRGLVVDISFPPHYSVAILLWFLLFTCWIKLIVVVGTPSAHRGRQCDLSLADSLFLSIFLISIAIVDFSSSSTLNVASVLFEAVAWLWYLCRVVFGGWFSSEASSSGVGGCMWG